MASAGPDNATARVHRYLSDERQDRKLSIRGHFSWSHVTVLWILNVTAANYCNSSDQSQVGWDLGQDLGWELGQGLG